MEIMYDEYCDLCMILLKVKEKRLIIYIDNAKNSLIESLFCCEKTK